MKNISIKCPDGFVNQLRLSLAANYLMSIGEARMARQEWVLNNHNIVDYNKFFRKLKYLSFEKINEEENHIKTASFISRIFKYGDPKKILRKSFSYLSLLDIPQKIINNFVEKNDTNNAIGVHVRTGCKTAILKQAKDRVQPISQEYIIDLLKNRNEKIYLATDNEETQSKFIDIFKDKIIIFQKLIGGKEEFGEYDRSKVTRNGTDIHVIADFFILKSCKYFIGSNESSFSVMINWLRDNKEDHELKGIL